MTERRAIGLPMLFAYVNRHPDAGDFLLEKDGNWNVTGVATLLEHHGGKRAADL